MTQGDTGAARDGSAPPPFTPYVDGDTALRELTPRALVLGALLGVVFGASSLYLVLKVGLTVSASIPVAVISIALFRLGVMLVPLLGGLLGILMMLPPRRALVVAQHGRLKYPEGTACAEVLKAGASEESRAAASAAARAEEAQRGGSRLSAPTIFTGFGIGLAYKTIMVALKGWKDVPERVFGKPFAAGSVAAEISPELLGVGYIIGPRISATMCAGGVLAYLVLIPLIKFFGDAIPGPLAPGAIPIAKMGPGQIRSAYVLYVGAGAVAAGGIVSLARSLPIILHGLREGLRDVGRSRAAGAR